MHSFETTKLKIPAVNKFDLKITFTNTNRESHTYEIGLHTHRELELYINLSGDVSFLVENNLYDLSRGDVIIARPGEYHHCIYRSDAPHKYFWILFDCQKNKDILDVLQNGFSENYVSPQSDLREELLDLCSKLHSGPLSNEEKIYSFFRIFSILKDSRINEVEKQSVLPPELSKIIDYIDKHIFEEITISNIAKAFYISQSSLERKFKKTLDITPLEYIRKKKLILAAELLQQGKSVLTAGTSVGYNDTSYFIELFKQYHGITPYQYKKKHYK